MALTITKWLIHFGKDIYKELYTVTVFCELFFVWLSDNDSSHFTHVTQGYLSDSGGGGGGGSASQTSWKNIGECISSINGNCWYDLEN